MTTKTAGRHRLPVRPRTPLTTIGDAVSTSASTVGRRSAVIAASSGLMVTMGLPAASAAPLLHSAGEPAAAPTTSSATPGADPTVTAPVKAQVNLALSSLTSVDASAYQAAQAQAQHDQQVAAAEKLAAGRVLVKQQSVPAPSASTASATAASASGASATAASAGAASTSVASSPAAVAASGSAAVDLARRYIGIPYRYGGTTPAGFDCSGFVKYVYAQLGVDLPRTAAQQAQSGTRISASDARPGDIVSFYGSGGVYHNGIYVGNGMMINSPRTGKTLQEQPIWSAAVVFTRVSA